MLMMTTSLATHCAAALTITATAYSTAAAAATSTFAEWDLSYLRR